MYQNYDFWSENKPSGNPAPQAKLSFEKSELAWLVLSLWGKAVALNQTL
jgi:hypothetical protein